MFIKLSMYSQNTEIFIYTKLNFNIK
jgi:hypothetical protein